jgi:cell division septum initiation protein DivIVA
MKTCGFEKQINPYLDGELSGAKLRSFEAHLEACPRCREEVEQYRGLLNELHGLEDLEVPPLLAERLHAALSNEILKGDGRVKKRKVWPWVLSTATAAVVIGAIGVAALFGGNQTAGMHILANQSAGSPNIEAPGTQADAEAMPAATMAAMAPIPAPTEAPAAMAPDFQPFAGAETTDSQADKAPAAATGSDNGARTDNPAQQANDRKIIYNANVVVQTREYNARLTAVEGLCAKYGGYTASSQENGKPGATDQNNARSAEFSLRIPIDKFDAAMADFKAMGDDVVSTTKSTDDVSRQYVDTDARNKTLKDERDRLEELLAKATDMNSIIALQNQITELTTEIEQQTAQLRFWDDQVAYSTINVQLNEIVEAQQVKPVDPSLNSRINGAFYGTLSDMRKGFENFEVGFVGFLPWMAIIIVVAGAAVAIAVPTVRRRRRAALKKAAEEKKQEDKP